MTAGSASTMAKSRRAAVSVAARCWNGASVPYVQAGELAQHRLVADDALEIVGQCGLARPRVLVGASPAWLIVSREPSIESCGVTSAAARKS